MTNFNQRPFTPMTPPKKNTGGIVILGTITLIAVAITAGLSYWVTRDSKEQAALIHDVQSNVQSLAKDTPLEGVVNDTISTLNKTPAPAAVLKPATSPGTLAGQSIQAEMSPPLSQKTTTETATKPTAQSSEQTPPSVNTPDSTKVLEGPSGTVVLTPPTPQVANIQSGVTSAKVNPEQKATDTQETPQNTTPPATTEEQKSGEQKSTTVTSPAEKTAQKRPATPTLPKVNQDSVVPLPFVDDVATWLVKRYNPQSGANLNLASINSRYGQKMHSLMPAQSQDVAGTRAQLLRYAFNTPMLTALYNLYADRFVESMNQAATKEAESRKKVVPAKVLSAYAVEFQSLGGLLQAIGSMPDFSERMQNYEDAAQATFTMHKEITDATHALQNAKESGEDTKTHTLRVDGLNAKYQRSIHDRNMAKENLVGAIRQKIATNNKMDADSILFVAQWLKRRNASTTSTIDNARTAGQLLQDLSSRLRRAQQNDASQQSPAVPVSVWAVQRGNA